MEIKDIRRLNLLGLKQQSRTMEAVGRAVNRVRGDERNYANYLNQITHGSRNMGRKTARDVEAGMGLPKGWMDTLQFQSPEDAVLSLEAAQISAGLPEAEREAWLQHGRLLLERFAKPKANGGNK